jgi:DNA-binding NtrC family response regulator
MLEPHGLNEAFVHEIGQSIGRPPAGVSREARQALMNYHWPGNVRELRNILERAAILCDGGLIAAEHLAFRSPATPIDVAPPAASSGSAVASAAAPAPADLKSVERTMIEKALKKAHFNKSEAAKALASRAPNSTFACKAASTRTRCGRVIRLVVIASCRLRYAPPRPPVGID